MTDYFLRITCPHDHDVVEYLAVRSESGWCVGYEIGEETKKPHVHILMRTSKTSQTLRNWVKSFGFSGNGEFSCSVAKDVTKCLSYCIKGGRFQREGYDDIYGDAVSYDHAVRQRKSSGVVDAIVGQLKKQGVSGSEPFAERIILRAVVDHYLKEEKWIRRHQIEACALTVMAKLNPDRFMAGCDQWAAKIFENF